MQIRGRVQIAGRLDRNVDHADIDPCCFRLFFWWIGSRALSQCCQGDIRWRHDAAIEPIDLQEKSGIVSVSVI